MGLMGPAAVPPNGFNASFYADPAMGRLQIAGIRTFDLAQRHRIYDTIQRMIVENVPIYTLLWVPLIEAYDSRLRGVKPSPSSIDFWNIKDWTFSG
jgi:ABC-type transport system substrate-binding protein